MRIKDYKIGQRLFGGFTVVLILLAVVWFTGVNSLSKITHELSIAKDVNGMLTDAQNAQGAALRYVIYEDDKYVESIATEVEKFEESGANAKSKMNSDALKAQTDLALKAVDNYHVSIEEYHTIQQHKIEAGTHRAAAGAKVLAGIHDLISDRIGDINKAYGKGLPLTKSQFESQLSLQKIRDAFNLMSITAHKYQLAITSAQQEDQAKVWLGEIAGIRELITFSKKGADKDELEAIAKINSGLKDYEGEVQEFRQINLDRWANMVRQKAAAVSTVKISSEVRDALYTFIDEVETNANLLLLVVSVVALIFGMLIAWFLTSGITKPINMIIEKMTQGSEQVSSAAGQVSSSSQMMAEGTSEQASAVEEISSTLEEMSSMTKQNAQNAIEANSISKEAGDATKAGQEAMEKMVSAVKEIKESSDETAKIIKNINEIAFQTNLLALNAAVEAARAGDAGKGFAVVAEEVRNLAQRSAQAANDTANLIEQSQKSADNGVIVTEEVGALLGNISGSVSKVNQLIAEVSSASKEQSQGISQVNDAVNSMDTVIQGNAATAEESASASEELSAQASVLNEMVDELIGVVNGDKGRKANRLPPLHTPAPQFHAIPYQSPKHIPQRMPSRSAEETIPFNESELKEF